MQPRFQGTGNRNYGNLVSWIPGFLTMNPNEIFKILFGIDKSDIQKTCVLLPFPSKDILSSLDVKKWIKGRLYTCGQMNHCSVIITGMGHVLTGDAVLHLKNSICENIILFGSCGAVKKTETVSIGTIVAPSQCFEFESFSQLLNKTVSPHPITASPSLVKIIKSLSPIIDTHCATFSSLYLEDVDSYTDFLKKINVSIVEMEYSAVLTASQHLNKNAIGLFYITDIIKEKPFYTPLSEDDKKALKQSKLTAVKLLHQLTEALN